MVITMTPLTVCHTPDERWTALSVAVHTAEQRMLTARTQSELDAASRQWEAARLALYTR